MKVPQCRLRSLLVLITLTALLLARVAKLLWRSGRPYSTVLAQFDPVTILASRPGYTVQGIAGGATFSISWGYAFKEWRGVVTASNDPSIRQTIQQSLESYVEKVSQGRFHTEGTLAGDPNETPQ